MPEYKPLVYLYPNCVTDARKAVKLVETESFDRIILEIANPNMFHREVNAKHYVFTRCDLQLAATEWSDKVVLRLSDNIDCDSSDVDIRNQNIQILRQEAAWAKYLNDESTVWLQLCHPNSSSVNLGRELIDIFEQTGFVICEIPITSNSASMWHLWNKFQWNINFKRNFSVALELGTTLPDESELKRWFGEPVAILIIPTHLFKKNEKKGFLYLPKSHESVCLRFMQTMQVNFAIKGDPSEVDNLKEYVRCLHKLQEYDQTHDCNIDTFLPVEFSFAKNGSVNVCQWHLNDLSEAYERAIEDAVEDLIIAKTKEINILIVGIDGWKMLSINMEKIAKKMPSSNIFIYEEDAGNRTFLEDFLAAFNEIEEEDKPTMKIISTTKEAQYYRKMNVIVNVALKTVYQNHWLQSNLEHVKGYIHAKAIMIPSTSKISVVPVMSTDIYKELAQPRQKVNCYELATYPMDYEIRAQMVIATFTRNMYECSNVQELFQFDHQNSIKSGIFDLLQQRFAPLTFSIDQDCVLHGFSGFFEMNLYKNHQWSNATLRNDGNGRCLPLMLFPVSRPQALKANSKLKANFLLANHPAKKEYWFEWIIEQPVATHIHNLNSVGNAFCFQLN